MKRGAILRVITISLIVLFTYAATSKLLDYEQFTVQISVSPILTRFAGYLAWAVPLSELFISVLLAYKRSRLLGLYSSFFMMMSFTLYIVAILRFSDHVPCACGGVLSMLGWSQHLVFNIVFVAIAAVGVFLESTERTTQTAALVKH